MSKKVLWIADPWSTLDHDRDTTLYLADVAATHFGLVNYWGTTNGIFFDSKKIQIQIEGIVSHYRLKRLSQTLPLSLFGSIHWRVDPPVTAQTFSIWNLIDELQVGMINSASGMLQWNEKLAPLYFKDWAVPSSLFQSADAALKFLKQQKRTERFVVKNLFDAASRGVKLVTPNSKRLHEEITSLTKDLQSPLLIQRYMKSIEEKGETRVFVMAGKPCGALQKKPNSDQIMTFDGETSQRPTLCLCKPSPEQRKRATHIAQRLFKDGIYFASIDFIESQVLEINVTSTGLLKWYDSQVEKKDKLALKYWKGLL